MNFLVTVNNESPQGSPMPLHTKAARAVHTAAGTDVRSVARSPAQAAQGHGPGSGEGDPETTRATELLACSIPERYRSAHFPPYGKRAAPASRTPP